MQTIKGLPTTNEFRQALQAMKQGETILITGLTLAQEMYVDGMLSMFSNLKPCILQSSNTGRLPKAGKLIRRVA